ncbi:MAG TPA: 1-deoxy-D-xylulose-5-phosphate reductoisomerase [Dehalococcoidia bacterium]|jgi:1-deoxy-D-xylulose-5-phosphate reductoisomerase|nr:1-deoxy-D-xylulose-5-phosphate reductoisomerase [Dehalococcoidia bacterium]
MPDSAKRIAILGSTGSIGQQTLDVVRALGGRFRVIGLAAGRNVALLAEQAREFRPEFIGCSSLDGGDERPEALADLEGEFLSLEDIASHPQVELVVIATSGRAGLSPTLAAVRAGKKVALANKEALVMAGEIITRQAEQSGGQILPIDSEHSAIWQCLAGEKQKAAQLILTASGGPFRDYSLAELDEVSVAQALKHPSWQMGKKVTIDSATLMNKGLEVIEAHWLFKMPFERIRVLIHRQSIIHSMVEFIDGSIKAQLSYPDMRLPIQYALSYPERLPNPELPHLDWSRIASLTFEPPDLERFPCLKLGIEAGKKGGTYPAVLCAADEVAVELFLSGRIRFTDIPRLIERTLEQHEAIAQPTLEQILEADVWARERTTKQVEGR